MAQPECLQVVRSNWAERLFDRASAAMARGWPLVLALVYLDCFGGILLGRSSFGFGQIFWHQLTIVLTLLLAALGDRRPVRSPDEQPRPARTPILAIALGATALGLTLGLLEVAGFAPPAQAMPLHWLVLGLAFASLMLLALAAASQLGLFPTRPLFSRRFK